MIDRPIIIIAAGRSGTKMLRDVIASHSDVVTWPCDEINPIWRYGNARYSMDELKPWHITPKIRRYIRSEFAKILRKYKGDRVVEKTAANSLRVEYVHGIFPEALFVHLIRDGRDVAASARRRWSGETKSSYIFKKGLWVPLPYIPYYSCQFVRNRLYRLFNDEKKLRYWGPRFSGLDDIVKTKSLIEVCGIQWVECIKAARRGLHDVPPSQVIEVKYETIVREPIESFRRIFEFCDLEYEEHSKSVIRGFVTDTHVGKWQRELSREDQEKLMPHIEELITELGYSQLP